MQIHLQRRIAARYFLFDSLTLGHTGPITAARDLDAANIDGDGVNVIIATLDRTALSGLSNDPLVMVCNTLGD